jgi:hypothetical protein
MDPFVWAKKLDPAVVAFFEATRMVSQSGAHTKMSTKKEGAWAGSDQKNLALSPPHPFPSLLR